MELELTLLAGPVNLPGEAPPEEAGEHLDGREVKCDFLFSIRRLRHRSPRVGDDDMDARMEAEPLIPCVQDGYK